MFDRLVLPLLLTAAQAVAASASAEFSITGAVAVPSVQTLATLQTLPPLTQTVSYLAGSAAQTHTYVGAGLWTLLDAARPAPAPLDGVVLATGSDGYRVVFALGELNPGYGRLPALAAHSEVVGGAAQPIGSDGFARTTAPGDVRGGRYVSNLVNLDVRASGSTQAGTGGGISTAFTVGGDVLRAGTFDRAALQALPAVTRVVDGVGYTGVSFWDLLTATVGIRIDAMVKNDVLNKYVVATGSDGYRAVFSLGELSPDFGNQPDIVAVDAGGAGLGSNGFARLVVPNDARRGRWVSNLVSLEVLSAAPVPEPGAACLLAAGLAVIGVFRFSPRWRGSRSTP